MNLSEGKVLTKRESEGKQGKCCCCVCMDVHETWMFVNVLVFADVLAKVPKLCVHVCAKITLDVCSEVVLCASRRNRGRLLLTLHLYREFYPFIFCLYF